MTVKLILPFLDPTAVQTVALSAADVQTPGAQAPWRTLPEKPVLGLIENGKFKADIILNLIGEALIARGAIDRVVYYKKPNLEAISPEALNDLIAEADIVISGMGDCGGCTAGSTTDALRACEQGVPGFIVSTEKFKFLVDATDNSFPIEGLGKLLAEHPIWTRDDEWFAATAERFADEVLVALGRANAASGAEQVQPTAPVAASIETILADLKAGMDADGYDMDIDARVGALAISVRPREGAGKLCLMPESDFARYVARVIKEAGIAIPADKISVTYPAQAAA